MDDGGEEDDQVEDEEEDEQPYLCFDFDGDESFAHDPRIDGDNVVSGIGVKRTCSSSASTGSVHAVETRGFSEVGAGSSSAPTGESAGDFSELLDSAAVSDGLEVFASTPRPPPVAVRSSQHLRSAGLEKLSKASTVADSRSVAFTTTVASAGTGSEKTQGTRTRDQVEAQRFPELVNYSNRLGGDNLADFRDNRNDGKILSKSPSLSGERIRPTMAVEQRKAEADTTFMRSSGQTFGSVSFVRNSSDVSESFHDLGQLCLHLMMLPSAAKQIVPVAKTE
ncbi:Histone-lysine N-methyltransferase [Phytophthora cinnamomi]|uniref:Histone-lysine N-methyltransferase n=1 Tax=Phytophthora cinnamomi TaxID=4785 RepID=UPI00355A7BDE|nr:Histone-lysine N-methyltransferase [Phytophthora cinnamomi]